MVLYEYDCSRCGRFELKQNIHDDALTSCPNCGGSVHRVLYPAGILWKGDSRWERRKGAVQIPEKDW